jgi:hypothetical protein
MVVFDVNLFGPVELAMDVLRCTLMHSYGSSWKLVSAD